VLRLFQYVKGPITPVADAKTITEIIRLFFARAAKELWHRSTENTRRVLSGDIYICEAMSPFLHSHFFLS